eukprot:6174246-Pleurochrysis_carterae.AAC.3
MKRDSYKWYRRRSINLVAHTRRAKAGYLVVIFFPSCLFVSGVVVAVKPVSSEQLLYHSRVAPRSMPLKSYTRGPTSSPTQSWWLSHSGVDSSRDGLDDLPAADWFLPQRQSEEIIVPLSADTVIVGAGMTGCAAAYWLSRLGQRSCLVLDARGVAAGATGRNGGHLWPNPTSNFQRETTRELLQILRDHHVDCDLTEWGAAALHRASEPHAVFHDAEGDPEAPCDAADWGEGVWWDADTCAEKMRSSHFAGASYYGDAAQFYPAKVADALLRLAGDRARLLAPVTVNSIDTDPSGQSIVRTDAGDIIAKHVLVATNGWAPELLPELQAYLFPCVNQVLMTRPVRESAVWHVGGISVDEGAREVYAIMRPDRRVCIGGARALLPGAAVGDSDDSVLSQPVGEYLRSFLAEHFGELGSVDVEAEWTGVLGFTIDGNPICGPVPGRPGVYVAAGFCGQGMVQCTGAAKAIVQMILKGRCTEDVAPFIRDQATPERFVKGSTAK